MCRDYENCLAYVTHLRDEHERIDARMSAIADAWEDCQKSPQSREVLLRLLGEMELLLAQLAHHFREEEEDGCLEEAAAREPHLCHRVDTLEHAHPGLTEQLESLVARVRGLTQPRDTIEQLQAAYTDFAAQLQSHEEAENEVLAKAFGIDL